MWDFIKGLLGNYKGPQRDAPYTSITKAETAPTVSNALQIPAVWECDTAMYFDPLGVSHKAIPGFRDWAEKHGICRDITEGDPDFRAVKMFCFTETDGIELMKMRTAEAGMPSTSTKSGRLTQSPTSPQRRC